MRNLGKQVLCLLLLVLFCVLAVRNLREEGADRTWGQMTLQSDRYRNQFCSGELWEKEEKLSEECAALMRQVRKEAVYFPVPESTVDASLTTSYVDTWMADRTYGGERGHEGTDIMASRNERGLYPVLSMGDGVISNLGWLEQGGYRIGITGESGVYYYYAHLDSYADLAEGDSVKAGELLGYMGDSGYGEEGTTGKFDVHLHVGIYVYQDGEEISLNPYHVLRMLEARKLKYAYS